MNRLLIPVTALAATSLSLGVAHAQDAPPSVAGAAPVAKVEAVEKLRITPELRKQILQIRTEGARNLDAIRANTSLSPAERSAQISDAQNATLDKIYDVLPPDQRDEWLGGGWNERTFAHALTPDQIRQLRNVVLEQYERRRAVRNNKQLSARDRGTQLNAIAVTTEYKIVDLLAPDQKEDWIGRGWNNKTFKQPLTQAQIDKIQPLWLRHFEARRNVETDSKLSPKERQQKLQQVQQEAFTQISQILTPEQAQEWLGKRAVTPPPPSTPVPPPPTPAAPPPQSQNLPLSPEQRQQINQLHATAKSQIEALQHNSALTAAQRNAQQSDILDGEQNKVYDLLTPAQREAWFGGSWTEQKFKNKLTADQISQLRKLSVKTFEARRTVKSNPSLGPTQKVEQYSKIARDYQTQILQILTPEQRAEWTKK